MPTAKPPEFEARPAIAEPDPGSRASSGTGYSFAFKVVSSIAGCFAFFAPGCIPTMSDPLSNAQTQSIWVFCILVYAFLQIVAAWQQRHHPQTRRTWVYFWLLALFPVWSLPVAAVLTAVIIQIGFALARNA